MLRHGRRFRAGSVELTPDSDLDRCGCATANRGPASSMPDNCRRTSWELAALGVQRHFHAASDTRPHLAHLQVVHPTDVPRFARRGAIANLQPLYVAREPQVDWPIILFLGPERGARQCPFGPLSRSGARLAAGRDWPVSSPDPLQGIQVAASRATPDGGDTPVSLPAERIGLAEALTVFTAGSAYVNHLDDTGQVRDLRRRGSRGHT